ncbi:S-layer homology domain-containing protein [Paenibacillus sabinae]|uniref:S-layer homology domain-containing protein n=1 Tax=Paenibacillus sabinae TaxID=365617 RepID=UPI0009FFC8F7|nr:S-layer homology domain-containing protein [Paenibacillus sabinae]
MQKSTEKRRMRGYSHFTLLLSFLLILTSIFGTMPVLADTSSSSNEAAATYASVNTSVYEATYTATASFSGTKTVTEWDVNGDGLTITIALGGGSSFADNVSDYKDAIIDGLTFYGELFNKTTNQYDVIPFDTFITSALNAYGSSYFPFLNVQDGVSVDNVTVYDRFVGLDPKGARSTASVTDELKEQYPGVKKGIINALKAGATVSVDSNGNLVIRCTEDAANGYFSTFTNSVPVVNGGIQIANCDILLSAELPAGVVNGVNDVVTVDGYFTIEEMKLHPEIWEYVDASRANEAGVYSFNSRIDGNDSNTSSPYPYSTTYYIKKVEGNELTEEDIRNGGTMGPNGTGSKLIKIVVDTRTGPTQWASAKNMSTFFTNIFRTNKDATGYSGGSSNTYTPQDDPEWLKVEDQITSGGLDPANPYYVGTNKYVINYSGDHRADQINPAPMWIYYELPKTSDFDISSNMPVYVNLIAGFFGGSGQSTNENGQPILGMDGRFSFTIKADGPKSTVSTISSSSYTINTAAGTITNVPYNTSKATFLGNLAKGESHQTWDTDNLHDPVTTGDTLVVTAQDGTTKAAYTITLNILPSTVTTISSSSYTVNTAAGTITNVPYNTSKATFLGNLTKRESDQTWDTANVHDPVVTGDTLVVTAQDGTTKANYTITVNTIAVKKKAPDFTADNTDNYVGKTIDLTFADDAAYRAAITSISVNGTILTADRYTISEGKISLNGSLFTSTNDYTIVVKAQDYKDVTVVQSIRSLVTASFSGANTVTEWDINGDGLTITIALSNGYSFADNVSAYKDAIIDGLIFNGVKFDKSKNDYDVVSYDTFITSVLNAYSSAYFPYVDKTNDITAYDRFVGLDPKGASSIASVNDALKKQYPGVKKGIINALKAGATVSVDSNGNLVIRCTKDAANGYFSTFTNSVPVVNGGFQIANCDILLSANLPAGVVKGVNDVVSVDSYFTIQEVKLHPEIWEYVDASRANEAGVFSFNSRINSYDKNTSSLYPYSSTYYVKKVEGNELTEEDIRDGGTMGPNSTGNKLIKIVVDTRTGPTQWASAKNMSTFFTNLFRTSKYATGYSGGSSTTYTPADGPEWLKVENQITAGGLDSANPYNLCTNKYVINYSGDNRMDTVDPAAMWIYYELPKTPDFDISSNMPVYVNLIAGLFGGSGQSTNENGQPILGMDGRYSFTIQQAGLSSIAKITSDKYTVSTTSATSGTIKNVPVNTSKETFLSHLVKGESHQTWDTGNVHNPVATGDTLVVTAQNRKTKMTYTITVGADLGKDGIITAEVQILGKDSGIATAAIDLESITAGFSKVQSSLDGSKTVLVVIPKVEGIKSYLITLPASVLTQNTSEKKVKLKTEFATVTLPGNMLDKAKGANARNVTLSISKADVSTLTEEARTYIGDKPVIELGLSVDGNSTIWSNNNAPVTIAVEYTPTAQELNDPEHITVFYIDGSGSLIPVPSAKYDAATGMVIFSTTHFSKYAVASVYNTFRDIEDYGWAKKQIEVLASKGIISGKGAKTYSPAANITRADFMMLLVKTLGLTTDVNGNFGDVKEGDYYYNAVGIAKKLGIATGSGNNLFNPKAAISRQDMMVLSEKALRMVKKISATGSSSDLGKYSDKSVISGYAVNSIAALVKEGLIVGSKSRINPAGNTTRAEAAVFLYRIYNK